MTPLMVIGILLALWVSYRIGLRRGFQKGQKNVDEEVAKALVAARETTIEILQSFYRQALWIARQAVAQAHQDQPEETKLDTTFH